MKQMMMKIQIHFLIKIHQLLYRRSLREYQRSDDPSMIITAEYHKSLSKLLKKKEALMTNDEKQFVLNQLTQRYLC